MLSEKLPQGLGPRRGVSTKTASPPETFQGRLAYI